MGDAARRGRGDDMGSGANLMDRAPSQLGITGSMRARDVSRPTEADVAAAEQLVQVSYRPRSRSLPRTHD